MGIHSCECSLVPAISKDNRRHFVVGKCAPVCEQALYRTCTHTYIHTHTHTHTHHTRVQDPMDSCDRVKAGSPESSDCDSTDGAGHNAQLIPKHTDLGKRVLFFSSHDKKDKYGVLRYLGEPEFAEGIWCGIELDKSDGKNNGSKHGIRYFNCDANHGVFVPLAKVELDQSRRSRSRPNSAPSSRTPSTDRGTKKAKTMTPVHGSGKPHLNTFSFQQDLVSRLSTPTLSKRKPGQQPSAGRGPMKAFATKGIETPVSQKSGKKPNLAPFKSGGIQKAVSSENLRSLKDKEKRLPTGGMSGKKSSSQKDLRSTSTGMSGGKGVPAGQVKGRRKPARANSYSDLFDVDSSNTTTSSSSGVGSNSVGGKNKNKIRRSADLSSLSDTQVYGNWPRTSTPGNRSDQTPDGCSSPEGAEISDSHSTTSSTTDTTSSCFDKMDTNTPATVERGFMATPSDTPPTNTSANDGSVSLDSPPTGLVTQTSQFVRNERKTPSVDMCRVASPDGSSALPKQVYKNRPSGSATLPHPLTLQAAGSMIANGSVENGGDHGSLLSPISFMKQFLGRDASVSFTLTCSFIAIRGEG